MKKYFFIVATILATGFVSCSDNDTDSNYTPQGEQERVPIFLSMGQNNLNITTRGTGAVGGVTTDENKWHGEKLNVYMFDKETVDTLGLAIDPTTKTAIFDNEPVTTPSDTQNGFAICNTPKYYPMSGNFDFFAYRADDAAIKNANGLDSVPALSTDKKAYVLPIEIDGTQDLMVAKAEMPEAQKLAFEGAVRADQVDRFYSAFSARRKFGYDGAPSEYGVQPHFALKHLLSRIVFNVKANKEADTDANTGIFVDSVKITNVKYKADFTVAWKGTVTDTLNIDKDSTTTFTLKERTAWDGTTKLTTLTPKQPEWDTTADEAKVTRIGESFLLFPAAEYDLEIYLSQTPDATTGKHKEVYRHKLVTPSGDAFEAGKQYDVTFVTYGLEKIELEVELTPWEKGEDIPVDNDQL